MKLELTKTQIENLIELFEMGFIESIRNDTDIDSMGYLCDMCDIYKKLKETLKKEGSEKKAHSVKVTDMKCADCPDYTPDQILEGVGKCLRYGYSITPNVTHICRRKELQNE